MQTSTRSEWLNLLRGEGIMKAFLAVWFVRLFHELIFAQQSGGTFAAHEATWMPVLL